MLVRREKGNDQSFQTIMGPLEIKKTSTCTISHTFNGYHDIQTPSKLTTAMTFLFTCMFLVASNTF